VSDLGLGFSCLIGFGSLPSYSTHDKERQSNGLGILHPVQLLSSQFGQIKKMKNIIETEIMKIKLIKKGKKITSSETYTPWKIVIKLESIDSSSIYSNNNEGIAIWIKIIAGIIVQIHSIIWLSNRFLLTKELNNILTIINPTKVIIKTKIILIKSCKKINSSIMGELASCKPNWPQFIILCDVKLILEK